MVEEWNVIDTAGQAPNGSVGLMMFEHRDWSQLQEQVNDLKKKTQAYFSYVVDGDMAKDNPSFAGRPVWFRLVCQVPPPLAIHSILSELSSSLAKHKIEMQLAVLDPNDKTTINKLIPIGGAQQGAAAEKSAFTSLRQFFR